MSELTELATSAAYPTILSVSGLDGLSIELRQLADRLVYVNFKLDISSWSTLLSNNGTATFQVPWTTIPREELRIVASGVFIGWDMPFTLNIHGDSTCTVEVHFNRYASLTASDTTLPTSVTAVLVTHPLFTTSASR